MQESFLHDRTHSLRMPPCCPHRAVPSARRFRHRLTARFYAVAAITTIVILTASARASACVGPDVYDDTAETRINTAVVIDVLANDFGNTAPLDPSTVTIEAQPLDGTVEVDPTTGEVTYTPDQGFSGWDFFEYTVSDENGDVSDIAYVDIDVTDEFPEAYDDYGETPYDMPITIDVLANDVATDSPLDPSTVTIVSPPLDGLVDVDPATGEVSYLPDADFYGFDFFEYLVKDEDGSASNWAYVDIEVINEDPIIQNYEAVPLPDDVWLFRGTVVDENPGVMQIRFGGLLDGHTTTVESDGSFEYAEIFQPGQEGLVSAITTDELGVDSNEVGDFVE